MDAGSRDSPSPPDRPFALLVADGAHPSSPGAIEAALRRMGLQPEAVAVGEAETPRFRLHLGALRGLIARAGPSHLTLADPGDSTTSLLGAALPDAWRDDCWLFLPEGNDGAAHVPKPAQFYEFFRMTVLLIDLFGASHFFWSPARLWSDAPQFRGAIAEMQASGMPPVLHLVAFRRRDGRRSELIATRGLATFAGQELEASIPAGWDMAAMVRRLARVALDAMLHGPIGRAQQAPGLQTGEWVTMTPRAGRGDGPKTVLIEFSRDD